MAAIHCVAFDAGTSSKFLGTWRIYLLSVTVPCI